MKDRWEKSKAVYVKRKREKVRYKDAQRENWGEEGGREKLIKE